MQKVGTFTLVKKEAKHYEAILEGKTYKILLDKEMRRLKPGKHDLWVKAASTADFFELVDRLVRVVK